MIRNDPSISDVVAPRQPSIIARRYTYALVAGQRFYADPDEPPAAFERRVRAIVSARRAGFMIMIEGATP